MTKRIVLTVLMVMAASLLAGEVIVHWHTETALGVGIRLIFIVFWFTTAYMLGWNWLKNYRSSRDTKFGFVLLLIGIGLSIFEGAFEDQLRISLQGLICALSFSSSYSYFYLQQRKTMGLMRTTN